MPFDSATDDDLPKGIVRSRPLTAPSGSAATASEPSAPPRKAEASNRFDSHPGVITAIEPQARREGRVNVFVGGKFAIGLFSEVAIALGLKVGQPMTPERLEELAHAETLRRAREDAYNLLSFRDRSESEIADRLRRKGYEDAVIAEVQAHLQAIGFLDDARFAERWVAARGVGRGRRALQHELRAKGVDAETIAATLAEARDPDGEAELDAARREAWKKVGGKRPADASREAQAKLSAYLARRGFGWETIRPVLGEVFADSGEPGDEAEEINSPSPYTEGIPAER